PGVPAYQAVGAVRVVDVVADVLGVVAEPSGGRSDAGGDVTRLLVHDDPAGPDSELVMHGRARFRDCIPSAGYRHRTPTLPAVKGRKARFCRHPRHPDGTPAHCLRALLSMRARSARFLPMRTCIT